MRIQIRLTDQTFQALHKLSNRHCRNIRQQAVWIIERELERCELLQPMNYQSNQNFVAEKLDKYEEDLS